MFKVANRIEMFHGLKESSVNVRKHPHAFLKKLSRATYAIRHGRRLKMWVLKLLVIYRKFVK